MGKRNLEFNYSIGEEIDNLIILDRFRIASTGQKAYEYRCKKCGNKDIIIEGNLNKAIGTASGGCNVCHGKKVLKGYNDIATTDPWMVKYFEEKEYAETLTAQSNKRIKMKCPDCGTEKQYAINTLAKNKNFSCLCSDGVSAPEKIMRSILNQLDIGYETEYSPEWITPLRYDFYIPSRNMIVEMDGGIGHGNYGWGKSKTPEETENIDREKDSKAIKKGLTVIRIDCRESDFDYVYSNTINSGIFTEEEIKNINKEKTANDSLRSLVKEACELFKKGNSTGEISKELKVCQLTVQRYLKTGNSVGWCKYDTKAESKKGSSLRKNKGEKPVRVLKDGKVVGEYKSFTDVVNNSLKDLGVTMFTQNIGDTIRGRYKHYKGYTFELI